MPDSADGNIRIASGIQATAGIGRRISKAGISKSSTFWNVPIKIPKDTAKTEAIANPIRTLEILDRK